MSRTVYITGNDGSGKSTYARRFRARARGLGVPVISRHYYSSFVRRTMRGTVERFARVRARKTGPSTPTTPTTPAPSLHAASPPLETDVKSPARRARTRQLAATAFLWVYQSAMGVEFRFRDSCGRRGIRLMDRGYVDDLVSICQTLRVSPPAGLLRWTAWLFPTRRILYLSSGSDVEFSRITDVDLSPDLHRRKGEMYEQLVNRLAEIGAPIRRVCTAGPRSQYGPEESQ